MIYYEEPFLAVCLPHVTLLRRLSKSTFKAFTLLDKKTDNCRPVVFVPFIGRIKSVYEPLNSKVNLKAVWVESLSVEEQNFRCFGPAKKKLLCTFAMRSTLAFYEQFLHDI